MHKWRKVVYKWLKVVDKLITLLITLQLLIVKEDTLCLPVNITTALMQKAE